MSLGYFQRLAERTDLASNVPSAPGGPFSSQVSGSAAEQVLPEVNELRSVSLPSNDDSPQPQQRRESHRVAVVTRKESAVAEPPPAGVDENISENTPEDAGEPQESLAPDMPPKETLSLRERAPREKPSENSNSAAEQLDADMPRFILHTAAERKETESQAQEEMAPRSPAKDASASGPARTQPSFITRVERQFEPSFITLERQRLWEPQNNEAPNGPDPAAETTQSRGIAETPSLQVQAKPGSNRRRYIPEWSPPAEDRQQQTDQDNGLQISIGQIQIEVHAPPVEAPARPVPVAPPAAPARSRSVTRPTNLRRFYLRGW